MRKQETLNKFMGQMEAKRKNVKVNVTHYYSDSNRLVLCILYMCVHLCMCLYIT